MILLSSYINCNMASSLLDICSDKLVVSDTKLCSVKHVDIVKSILLRRFESKARRIVDECESDVHKKYDLIGSYEHTKLIKIEKDLNDVLGKYGVKVDDFEDSGYGKSNYIVRKFKHTLGDYWDKSHYNITDMGGGRKKGLYICKGNIVKIDVTTEGDGYREFNIMFFMTKSFKCIYKLDYYDCDYSYGDTENTLSIGCIYNRLVYSLID